MFLNEHYKWMTHSYLIHPYKSSITWNWSPYHNVIQQLCCIFYLRLHVSKDIAESRPTQNQVMDLCICRKPHSNKRFSALCCREVQANEKCHCVNKLEHFMQEGDLAVYRGSQSEETRFVMSFGAWVWWQTCVKYLPFQGHSHATICCIMHLRERDGQLSPHFLRPQCRTAVSFAEEWTDVSKHTLIFVVCQHRTSRWSSWCSVSEAQYSFWTVERDECVIAA